MFADAVNAFVSAPHFGPQVQGNRGLLHPDTSRGTPKVLFADSVSPTFNPPQPQIDRPQRFSDTTVDTPTTLLLPVLVTQAPFANSPWVAVGTRRVQPDTSYSTPKVLYADAVAPFVNPPQITPAWIRSVKDTSSFQLPPPAVVGKPFSNPPWLTVGTPRIVSETSASTPKVLYADSVTPTLNPPSQMVVLARRVADTSQSVPRSLLPVVTPSAPFVSALWPQVQRRADVRWDVPVNLVLARVATPAAPQPAAPVSLSGGSGGGMGGYGPTPYGAHVASERSKRIKRQNEVILQAVAALFGSNNT